MEAVKKPLELREAHPGTCPPRHTAPPPPAQNAKSRRSPRHTRGRNDMTHPAPTPLLSCREAVTLGGRSRGGNLEPQRLTSALSRAHRRDSLLVARRNRRAEPGPVRTGNRRASAEDARRFP